MQNFNLLVSLINEIFSIPSSSNAAVAFSVGFVPPVFCYLATVGIRAVIKLLWSAHNVI